eukprot:Skav215429  [mRNA]  locus=scaffold745:191894:193384:- [translate_table: standard]
MFAATWTLLRACNVTNGAEAQVQSEGSSGHYNVRVGRCGVSVNATCNCFDSRTRPGLCKHSAAVALIFLQNGHEMPQMLLAPGPTRGKHLRPPATPIKRPSPTEGVEDLEDVQELPAETVFVLT